MTLADIPQIGSLTAEEKLQLVEDIWDSIGTTPDALPVTEAEKKLLDERMQAHLESPDAAMTLEEFRRQLARRL